MKFLVIASSEVTRNIPIDPKSRISIDKLIKSLTKLKKSLEKLRMLITLAHHILTLGCYILGFGPPVTAQLK